LTPTEQAVLHQITNTNGTKHADAAESKAIQELKAKLKSKLVSKNEISDVINSPEASNFTIPDAPQAPTE